MIYKYRKDYYTFTFNFLFAKTILINGKIFDNFNLEIYIHYFYYIWQTQYQFRYCVIFYLTYIYEIGFALGYINDISFILISKYIEPFSSLIIIKLANMPLSVLMNKVLPE